MKRAYPTADIMDCSSLRAGCPCLTGTAKCGVRLRRMVWEPGLAYWVSPRPPDYAFLYSGVNSLICEMRQPDSPRANTIVWCLSSNYNSCGVYSMIRTKSSAGSIFRLSAVP